MTFFKFLFVLALAVPLAVFMWNYINKLSDEFQKSVSRSRGSRRPEQPGRNREISKAGEICRARQI